MTRISDRFKCINCKAQSWSEQVVLYTLDAHKLAIHQSCRMSGYASGISKEKLTHCKCKRSGCIRNYCLCYDQKRMCTSNCRCNNCQNRFELNMSNDNSLSKGSHPPTVREPSNTQNPVLNSRTNRKVLPDDTYDRFARSLYGAAKACSENQDDNETTKRKILETYNAELCRLRDELKKKLPSSSRP